MARSRAALTLAALLLGLLLAPALHGPLCAAEAGDATPEGMRRALLEASTPGAWEGVLDALWAQGVEQTLTTLTPLFTEPAYTKERGDLVPYCAAYLAANAIREGNGDRVLLLDLILARARDNPGFVRAMRGYLTVDWRTGRSPDWDRLLARAQARLTAPDPAEPARTSEERQSALRLFAQTGERDLERTLAALAGAARAAASAPPSPQRTAFEQTLLRTLDELLAYRFRSAAEAAQTLESSDLKGLPLVDLVRWFSRTKDGSARDQALVVKHGLRVIAQLDTPASLARALEEDEVPYPELKRALLARLAELKPVPGGAWDDVFVLILQRWDDPEPVGQALDLLVTQGFGAGVEDCCPRIAQAVQDRLVRAPAPGRPSDPPEMRVRLVTALGGLGSRVPLKRQVEHVLARGPVAPTQAAEVVALILAVGRGPGAEVREMLRPFYAMDGVSPEVRDALRGAVARALGRGGVRRNDAAAGQAALVGILEGSPEWERELSPKVREEALRSLGQHATREAVTYLGERARAQGAETDEEARVALQVLGQVVSTPEGAEAAARTLLEVLQGLAARSDGDERRVLALRGLKNLPPGVAPGTASDVRAALRAALAGPASFEVGAQAVRTLTDLADPGAVAATHAWWRGLPEARRDAGRDLLRGLLESLVRAGEPAAGAPAASEPARALDAAVAAGLETLAREPADLPLAVEWADLLVRLSARSGPPRAALLEAHGSVLLQRARSRAPTDPPQARIEDRRLALAQLDLAQQTPTPDLVAAERRGLLLLEALEGLALDLPAGGEGKDLLLRAVGVAVRSMQPALLRAGERIGRQVLGAEPWRSKLSAAEQATLDGQLEQIQRTLEKAGG